MSADNGFAVLPLDDEPEKWGIFYYSASFEGPTTALSVDATEVVSNPITAIIRAHRINMSESTEYGVHISEECLRAAELTMVEYLRGREW